MRRFALLLSLALLARPIAAQPDGSLASMAEQLITKHHAADRETELDHRFRLQLAATRYEEALETLRSLRELRARASGLAPDATLQYEVYATAKAREAKGGVTFDEAFASAFREFIGALDAKTVALRVPWLFGILPAGDPLVRLKEELRAAEAKQTDARPLRDADAVDLIAKRVALEAYRAFTPLVAALLEEDDRRRYTIEKDLLITTADGAQICAWVFRPRDAQKPLPALLNFTIYYGSERSAREARQTAAHGYAAVEGFTRGKACSPEEPIPLEHVGADAASLISWIAKQPWSDGRVGMYGGSYEGFAQWSAAKRLPPALKAMMPPVTFAPGVDFPMEGNVFMTYAFPWPFYTTNMKGLDEATYGDTKRWERLQRQWYVSGRPYRELDHIDGTPNPVFNGWLEHPSYDAYWRALIPYRDEFARIDIPVLTTTGYYDSGQIGALYYVREHLLHRPRAEHYLVIGPYDHIRGQRGTITPATGARQTVLRNYALDEVAQIDIGELRYQWFDYVLRGGRKPALLADRINYEVMGANVWKHAASIEAMHDATLRLYLRADGTLSRKMARGFTSHVVDLADRSDADLLFRGAIIDEALDDWNIVDSAPKIANAVQFLSEPLAEPIEISGLFSGVLDVVANKKDFDFSVSLLEVTPGGDYVRLSYAWSRASYARNREQRSLLQRGRRTRLPLQSRRLTSRRVGAGSRLLVVIGVIKQPSEQINYGTGKDVSDESIADAREPLRLRWLADSYIDVPVMKEK